MPREMPFAFMTKTRLCQTQSLVSPLLPEAVIMVRRMNEFERECRRLGEAVAQRRTARAMTQAALAAGADLSVDGLARIERGLSAPNIVTLVKLAQALGCPTSELLQAFTAEEVPTGFDAVLRGQPIEVVTASIACAKEIARAFRKRAG